MDSIVDMKIEDSKTDIPKWEVDHIYKPGDEVQYMGDVYVASRINKQRPLDPESKDSNVWTRIYAEYIQNETYSKGQEVKYNGCLKRSLIDNNNTNVNNRDTWQPFQDDQHVVSADVGNRTSPSELQSQKEYVYALEKRLFQREKEMNEREEKMNKRQRLSDECKELDLIDAMED